MMMESISLGGHPAMGFGSPVGVGSLESTITPVSKVGGFFFGATLAGLGGLAASYFGANRMPLIAVAALGGGIAGAIIAPGSR
jgi:hypothetical protein